jgi:hypothetical protein
MITIGAIAVFVGFTGVIIAKSEQDTKWFGKIIIAGAAAILLGVFF